MPKTLEQLEGARVPRQADSIYDGAAGEEFRRRHRLDPHILHKLRTHLFKHFAGLDAALEVLPPSARDDLRARFVYHPLTLHDRIDSQLDGATKLLFRTHDGHLLESVLLRTTTGRVALCISSQVGCAAACDFCATGKMGLARNLTSDEILDQVVQANQLLRDEQRKVRNIVLMGMGEPFHNEQAVQRALRRLIDAEFFHHSPRRILVSTVGIPDAMVRLAQQIPQVNLALSLHSADPDIRRELFPIAARYSLNDLRHAIGECNSLQHRPVMIEYLMLAGRTDRPEDATRLADFLAGLDVHINLIPYNSIASAPHLIGSDRSTRDAFAERLRAAGLTTTIRYSLGNDIAAACGQLVQERQPRKPSPTAPAS